MMLIDFHVERLDSCTTLSYIVRRVRFQKGRIFYRSSESVYYTNESDRCQSYMDLAMWQDLEGAPPFPSLQSLTVEQSNEGLWQNKGLSITCPSKS